MPKYWLLIASCFVLRLQLSAGPIQTIPITSLSYFSVGGGPVLDFTASGPSSLFIQGHAGQALPDGIAPTGMPIGVITLTFFAGGGFPSGDFMPRGLIGGIQILLEAPDSLPLFTISGHTDLVVPDLATGTAQVTFPGTATGGFAAFSCSIFEHPPGCTGPQIANIVVDLTGLITVTYIGNLNTRLDRIDFAGGVSSVPEPSAILLSLIGLALLVSVQKGLKSKAVAL